MKLSLSPQPSPGETLQTLRRRRSRRSSAAGTDDSDESVSVVSVGGGGGHEAVAATSDTDVVEIRIGALREELKRRMATVASLKKKQADQQR